MTRCCTKSGRALSRRRNAGSKNVRARIRAEPGTLRRLRWPGKRSSTDSRRHTGPTAQTSARACPEYGPHARPSFCHRHRLRSRDLPTEPSPDLQKHRQLHLSPVQAPNGSLDQKTDCNHITQVSWRCIARHLATNSRAAASIKPSTYAN